MNRPTLKFDSFDKLKEFVKKKEEKEYVRLFREQSRTIEAARKKNIRRPVKEELKFYSITYSCIHGRTRRSRSTGIRPFRKSFRQNCPFKMRLKPSVDGNFLEVVELNDKHNHSLNKDRIYNFKKTGVGDGPNISLSKVDERVLEIIGIDIPAGQEEATSSQDESEKEATKGFSINNQTKDVNNDKETLEELNKTKLRLVIENLNKESYFKSLQILKLEKELLLPPSVYTEALRHDSSWVECEYEIGEEADLTSCDVYVDDNKKCDMF